jgi:hypothetical protein
MGTCARVAGRGVYGNAVLTHSDNCFPKTSRRSIQQAGCQGPFGQPLHPGKNRKDSTWSHTPKCRQSLRIEVGTLQEPFKGHHM